jgi:hypothetical protein
MPLIENRSGIAREKNGEVLTAVELRFAAGYFFFRFGGLSLKGPLIPSATASRAKRSNSARSFFGGNANGLPRFHSVGFRVDFLVCFLAMRSLSHAYRMS